MPVIPLTRKDGSRVDGKDTVVTDPLEELKILLARGKKVKCIIDDQLCEVEIKPFVFDRLPEILEATSPIMNMLKTDVTESRNDMKALIKGIDTGKILQFCADNKDQILTVITAFEPEITIEQAKTLRADDIVELLVSIIEVNLDFFIRRVSPALIENLVGLVQLLPKFTSTLPKR